MRSTHLSPVALLLWSRVFYGDPLPEEVHFWQIFGRQFAKSQEVDIKYLLRSKNLNLKMRKSRGDGQVAKNTIKSGLVAEHHGRFDNFRTDFPYVRAMEGNYEQMLDNWSYEI